MTDQEFNEQHKPLVVVANFEQATTIQEQVIFALAEIGKGTAEDVVKKLEELNPAHANKLIIAETHQVLAKLFEMGLIAGTDTQESLIYSLQKITEANSGKV